MRNVKGRDKWTRKVDFRLMFTIRSIRRAVEQADYRRILQAVHERVSLLSCH